MEVPRGFTRCDECGGEGGFYGDSAAVLGIPGGVVPSHRCEVCRGSGLVPTEKLREEIAVALFSETKRYGWAAGHYELRSEMHDELADAVLRKVAEHLGDRE